MKRTIGFALALGLAVSVAGCATGGGGAGGAGAPSGTASTAGAATTAEAGGSSIRDFNLRVRCPGIHLEKSKLGWSEEKIMAHENVSKDEIDKCEAWAAAQPKGYVPPPPPGVKPKTATEAKK